MRRFKNLTYYTLTIGFFLLLIIWVLKSGKALELNNYSGAAHGSVVNEISNLRHTLHIIIGNLHHPLAILILQIISILFVARLFGLLFSRMGQPMVIGEIVAGIVLGPSVLGTLWPGFSSFLFPPESLQNIYVLSQIGLILFMFVIGMDLDLSIIRKKASDSFAIGHSSIIVPFIFGIILSYFLYSRYAPTNIPFYSFAIFISITLSITAFPVLARIIQEKGWTKTHLGIVAITSAAFNDIAAWCILAIIIALVKAGSIYSSLGTILMAVLYVCFMILFLKPFLVKMKDAFPSKETMNKGIIALYFLILLSSSFITELIGIHALFGAFMAGLIMPSDIIFRKVLIEKIEDISLVLLLPLFFVYTGLKTDLGLMSDGHLWATCGIVILVAIIGKFFGTTAVARMFNQTWRDSLALGALMNTRGLMQLIVLEIGFELGVISPEIFVIMVIMALVTTFMTGPALGLINQIFPLHITKAEKEEIPEKKILISYGPSATGVKLLRLASEMSVHNRKSTTVTTLHFTRGTDLHPLRAEEFANESFKPILKEAFKAGIQVVPKYKVTDNVDQAILRTVERGEYDLLLIGAGRAVIKMPLMSWFFQLRNNLTRLKILKQSNGTLRFSGKYNLIHEKARYILEHADCTVGVFIDRDFEKTSGIFLPILNRDDVGILSFLENFMMNEEVNAFIYDKAELIDSDASIKKEIESIQNQFFSRVHFIDKKHVETDGFFSDMQLMLISVKGWKYLIKNHKNWVKRIPSTLIIKNNGNHHRVMEQDLAEKES